MVGKMKLIGLILILFSLFAIISSANADPIDLDINNFTKGTIQSAADGTVFNLDPTQGNYDLSSDNNININKTITIQSSVSSINAVLDLQKSGRAFSVTSTGTLTLINITIINGNLGYDDYGGAISNNGGSLTLKGCNFSDNYAERRGGAIYITGSGSVDAEDCIFINNSVDSQGGAFYSWYNSKINLTNCYFSDNSAPKSDGGAIYNENATAYLTGCTFIYNTGRTCGAIGNYGEGDITLYACIFTNNSANYGGAICNMEDSRINITDCDFINNTAYYNGGAIQNDAMGEFKNCTFTNNSAFRFGGAIHNYDNITLTDCKFTNNNVTGYGYDCNGGAIYNQYILTLNNCNFTDNSADDNGGAIYNKIWSRMYFTLIDCNFINNSANFGGAVYFDGGAYDIEGNFSLDSCNFTNNTVTKSGGAIYSYEEFILTVDTCTFTNNVADDDYGGAIYNYGGSVSLENCTFSDNVGCNGGGAIYNNYGILTVDTCTFTNNTDFYGGAIYIDGESNLTLINSTFINNTADFYGGAIYNDGESNLTLINSTFINNYAEDNGGAIYNANGNITINACNFTNNNVDDYRGGAIFNGEGCNLTVDSCIFISNSAYNGGAIATYNSNLDVRYSVFSNNNGDNTLNIAGTLGTCYLEDNFYFWINPMDDLNSFKEAITNEPDLITSFYYLSITNDTISSIGDILNITSKLLYYDGSADNIDKLPDLNNITINYNDEEIANYNYKEETKVSKEIDALNDFEFYYEDYLIYSLSVNIDSDTLSSISGTGKDGTSIVEVTVDEIGTYWIIIYHIVPDGTTVDFNRKVEFDTKIKNITLEYDPLDIWSRYYISAYEIVSDVRDELITTGNVTVTTVSDLSSINGSGVNDTSVVNFTVDELGTYWIVITDENDDVVFSNLVIFDSYTVTVSLDFALDIDVDYNVYAYSTYPEWPGAIILANCIVEVENTPPTLSYINGSGVEGSKDVKLVVDVPGTYWIVITDEENNIVFSEEVIFITDTFNVTLTSSALVGGVTYTIEAYGAEPDVGDEPLTTNTFTVEVTPDVLSSINGSGVEGSNEVELVVDVPGTYWVVITDDEGKEVFSKEVTFATEIFTVTLPSSTLVGGVTYTIEAYNDNPSTGSLIVKANFTINPSQVLNYDALHDAINANSGLNNKDFLINNWDNFQKALDSAIALNKSRNATSQDEIDLCLNALIAARKNLTPISPPIITHDYSGLLKAISSVSSLDSKKYTLASWNAFKAALAKANNLHKAKNANSQAEIDAMINDLNLAKSKLVVLNVDLKITKIVRSGNNYKVSIKNLGKDKSTKTKLKIFYKKGKKTFSKAVNVKAINGGKTLLVTVKFFKFATHNKIIKTAQVNYNKMAYEKNFKNNVFKIKKGK